MRLSLPKSLLVPLFPLAPARACSSSSRAASTTSGALLLTFCEFINNNAESGNDCVHLTASLSLPSLSFLSPTPPPPHAPLPNSSRAASPTSGALLFTFCEFINNTAESGNGGALNVGQEPVGGPRVQLAGCTFRGNRAEKGKGGAIYSEDNVLYMKSVKFEKNYALVGGGAIATTAKSLTIVKSTFFRNVAVQPPTGRNNGADSGGGAILVSSRDTTLSLCSTSFASNHNSMREQAGDIAVPGLRDNLQHITGMVRLPSYKQCQQQCLATQVQQADYCNLWAYIANSAANGECGGKCIMFHDPDDCGVGKIVANNQLGVWYQYAEPSFNACS
ncbi:unnamed protein product [Closterium sp. NIES-54]